MIIVEEIVVDCKSDEKANEFRESGNNEYKNKNYFDALISYNKSISHALTKRVLSLGYANRSAVYLEIDCFDECLKNIEWARKYEYPANKLSKLDDRERKCKKLMSEGKKYVVEDPWNFFKLSYPANKKIPWIVECLKVRTTEKFGRGIYATQDLKAGDIISIEEPVIHMGSESLYYQHCTNCFKTCLFNLIPSFLTNKLMFCSNGCMENFYLKAGDVNLLREDGTDFMPEIAIPFGGYEQLDNFINKQGLKDLKKTIFDYDLSDPQDPDYRKNLMICFLSVPPKCIVQTKDEIRGISDFVSEKAAKHISKLHIRENSYVQDYFGKQLDDGYYGLLFKSLINHSCLKNVKFVAIDNKLVTIVIRPIKAGEQLFDCYYNRDGPNHAESMEKMMKSYKFKCDCQECLDGSYKYIDFFLPSPHTFMSRKDFTKAKKYLKACWKKLNNSKDPQELIEAEYQSFQIMSVFGCYVTYPYHKMDEKI